jgi:hypothetical protein
MNGCTYLNTVLLPVHVQADPRGEGDSDVRGPQAREQPKKLLTLYFRRTTSRSFRKESQTPREPEKEMELTNDDTHIPHGFYAITHILHVLQKPVLMEGKTKMGHAGKMPDSQPHDRVCVGGMWNGFYV